MSETGWIILLIVIVIVAVIVGRDIYELHHLKLTGISFNSDKVAPQEGIRAVFLTDLHNRTYGAQNAALIRMIRQTEPDYIFLGGDMITDSAGKKDSVLFALLEELKGIAPVIYALGNHEQRVISGKPERGEELLRRINENGVTFLSNGKADLNGSITVYGLDMDRSHYNKINTVELDESEIEEKLGKPDKERFNILMAHMPQYMDAYSEYGADLALAGHYHGGSVRFSEHTGLISPQLRFFPKYCVGLFEKDGTSMYVSAGCGSHTFNVRLNNRPEVVVIDICGKA